MKDLKQIEQYTSYSKYKDPRIDWIGEVPEHWEIKPLFAYMKKKQLKNVNNIEQNVLSLSYGKIVRRDVESNFGLLPESFETYQIVEPGNIILRLTDLQNDKRSLRVGLVKERGIITSAYLCLQITTEELNSQYTYYLLHTYDLKKVFYNLGSGVRQSLKYDELKRMPLLIPPLKEQETIAEFLDFKTFQIDSIIKEKERLIELLQEQRQAIITEAVTKGLNPNVKMKDSGIEVIGEIPANWDIVKLKYLTNEKLMYGANESAELEDKELPRYIRITDIDEKGNLKDETFKSLPMEKAKDYLLKQGDILLARSGATVGKAYFHKNDSVACFAGYLIRYRANTHKVNPKLVYYFTQSKPYADWIKENIIQATIQNVSAEKYANLYIPLPERREQDEIVQFIEKKEEEIDILLNSIEEQIQKLKEYRQSLIYEAVTGKIDVRDYTKV